LSSNAYSCTRHTTLDPSSNNSDALSHLIQKPIISLPEKQQQCGSYKNACNQNPIDHPSNSEKSHFFIVQEN